MKTVILTKPKLKVRLRVIPGSARIEVTFPGVTAAMFDPITERWHRAGPDQPNPVELLRHFGNIRLRNLEAKLTAINSARFWNLRKGIRKRCWAIWYCRKRWMPGGTGRRESHLEEFRTIPKM